MEYYIDGQFSSIYQSFFTTFLSGNWLNGGNAIYPGGLAWEAFELGYLCPRQAIFFSIP
jgi:hypothetical protein